MTKRVVVLLDWQNVYKGARESFHVPTAPSEYGQVHPLGLGELIASKIPDGWLKQVRVYRGIPSNAQDPQGYAAVRKHTAAWTKQDPNRVHVYHRPLQYLPGMSPREKGIDVRLAIDYVAMAVRAEYDVGVLFSTDTDLVPALDAVCELRGGNVVAQTAGWDGPNYQKRCIRPSGKNVAVCVWIDTAEYYTIKDATRYARKSPASAGTYAPGRRGAVP